jgi:hypothetical protein
MKNMYLVFSFFLLLLSSALFSQNYEIYVCDAGNFNNPPWQILRYDSSGQNGTVYIDEELAWPQDIVFLEGKNEALISNLNTGRITRYNATTGDYIDNFATGLGGPTRMKIRNDTLFVCQWNAPGATPEHVAMFDLTGNSLGNFTTSGVVFGIGIDWDGDGNLYVSSYGQPNSPPFVRKFNTQGISQGDFITNADLVGPTNIWFDPSGNGDLLVVDYNAGIIKRFDSNGDFMSNFITGLNQPEGVAFLTNGNILIGNGGTGTIKLYTSDGTFISNIITSGNPSLIQPNCVIIREISPVSVSDPIEQVDYIFPSIGVEFFVKEKMILKIQSYEIYNASGGLVLKNDFSKSRIWDASNVAEGMYLIRSKMKDGKILLQKVMVKK